jgi:hypothetical protein
MLAMSNSNEGKNGEPQDADGHTPGDTVLGRLNKPADQQRIEADNADEPENVGDTVLAHLNKPSGQADHAHNDHHSKKG